MKLKKTIFSVVALIAIMVTMSVPAFASMDRPVVNTEYNTNNRYVLFFNTDNPTKGKDYCLNQLTSTYPIQGTNLTKALWNPNSSGNNSTQEFVRVKLWVRNSSNQLESNNYWGWGCADQPYLLMYTRKTNPNYVNVQALTVLYNGVTASFSQFNVHSAMCVGLGSSSGMFLHTGSNWQYMSEKTDEPVAGGCYLVWRNHTSGYLQNAVAIYARLKKTTGAYQFESGGTYYNCPHSKNRDLR